MIHQSSIYTNIIVIIQTYINRLSLTMQIFIAMNYLMLEKYLHFRKQQKHVPRNLFHLVEVTEFMYLFHNSWFFELSSCQRFVQKLERNWNFEDWQESGLIKILELWNFEYSFFVWESLVWNIILSIIIFEKRW